MNPRVINVVPLQGFQLRVTFTNGELRVFDVTPYLNYPAFKSLNNPGYFTLAHHHHGTVRWPNGVDFCPDTVYLDSVPEEPISE
ncbi:MAG: DUF2442 domain-containing protein [Methylococcaceae bacterium]|nr:MAG: DUF2442 domain-containing protein [Methylococcaceae bacterium]